MLVQRELRKLKVHPFNTIGALNSLPPFQVSKLSTRCFFPGKNGFLAAASCQELCEFLSRRLWEGRDLGEGSTAFVMH